MATSIDCGVPCWLENVPMSGQTPFRTYDVGTRVYSGGTASANQVPSGVFPGQGGMQVVAASGLNVTVQAGYCCVANSSSSLQGGYIFGLMNSAALTVAAADATSPRIDIVVAYVADNGDSTSFSAVQIITGTPAASPSAPAAPANSLTLAQIAVAANVISVSSGNITDTRTYVVAPGGILPIATASAAPAVPATQFMYQLDTGQLVQGTGVAGSVTVAGGLKWTPQMSVITSNVTAASGGALTTVTSVSVTTDGSTDIEIYCKWAGVEGSAGHLAMNAYIDGVLVNTAYATSLDGTSSPTSGGAVRYFTSGGQGTTPTAGTHTVAFKFQAAGGGTSASDKIIATSTAPAVLRVAPVAV